MINKRNKHYIAILGILTGTMMLSIDFSIVNTALPKIQQEFQLNLMDLHWIMDSFAIALCSSLIIMGKLADVFNKKNVYLSALILLSFASLGAGLATNLPELILARVIQGLAIAALSPCSLAILLEQTPQSAHLKTVSLWATTMALGLALGPAIGGFVIYFSSWHWIFWLNLPFCIISLILCWLFISTPTIKQKSTAKIDFLGAILLVVGLSSLIILMLERTLWQHIWIMLSLTLAAIASFYTFYRHERATQYPIIDFSFFAHRQYLLASFIMFTIGFTLYTSFFMLPLYLSHIGSLSMLDIGLLMLCITVFITLLSKISPKLVKRFEEMTVIRLGLIIMIAAFLLQCFFSAHFNAALIISSFILFGTGWGIVYTTAASYSLQAIPKAQHGTAGAIFITLRNFSGAVGLALSGLIFTFNHHSSESSFIGGFHNCVYLSLSVTALSLIILFKASQSHSKNTPHHT